MLRCRRYYQRPVKGNVTFIILKSEVVKFFEETISLKASLCFLSIIWKLSASQRIKTRSQIVEYCPQILNSKQQAQTVDKTTDEFTRISSVGANVYSPQLNYFRVLLFGTSSVPEREMFLLRREESRGGLVTLKLLRDALRWRLRFMQDLLLRVVL